MSWALVLAEISTFVQEGGETEDRVIATTFTLKEATSRVGNRNNESKTRMLLNLQSFSDGKLILNFKYMRLEFFKADWSA